MQSSLEKFLTSHAAQAIDQNLISTLFVELQKVIEAMQQANGLEAKMHVIKASDLVSDLKVELYAHILEDDIIVNIYEYISYLSQIIASGPAGQDQNFKSTTPIASISDAIFKAMAQNRLALLMRGIADEKSLMPESGAEIAWSADAENLKVLYSNIVERIDLHFDVSLLPFKTEVLDPRIVKIPAGKRNEKHKHAHETIFVFMAGIGEVIIDDVVVPVKSGDIVFIPRWSIHQSCNTGTSPMCFLAVADFGLTGKAYMGDYVKTTRMRPEQEHLRDKK